VTRNTVTETRAIEWTIRRNDITFDESVDIKFKSTFNTTNPKKNPREKVEYLEVRNLISFLKPNLSFLIFQPLNNVIV